MQPRYIARYSFSPTVEHLEGSAPILFDAKLFTHGFAQVTLDDTFLDYLASSDVILQIHLVVENDCQVVHHMKFSDSQATMHNREITIR
jgi:hypothetical protein